jgi:RNA polymerase sigma factor (sigma-70 family)
MSSLPEPGAQPDFDTWFRKTAGQILRQAYLITRNAELAEDIAQETALKAYKAWATEEKRAMILTRPAYVRKIVLNCFLDHVKVLSRTRQREVGLDLDRHDGSRTEVDHDLRIAVLSLGGDEQDMIVLRYYHDLTIKEAGIQLGLSQSQAYRLHDQALARLAGLLDEGEA